MPAEMRKVAQFPYTIHPPPSPAMPLELGAEGNLQLLSPALLVCFNRLAARAHVCCIAGSCLSNATRE